MAVTFARQGCFISTYAKTSWSFLEENAPGKKQELLYWDDGGYASIHDSVAHIKALEKKEEEDKQADVDAFLNSLEGDSKQDTESEIVAPPPAINLSLGGSLYALWSHPAHSPSFVVRVLILFALAIQPEGSQKVGSGNSIKVFYADSSHAEKKKGPTELIISKKVFDEA